MPLKHKWPTPPSPRTCKYFVADEDETTALFKGRCRLLLLPVQHPCCATGNPYHDAAGIGRNRICTVYDAVDWDYVPWSGWPTRETYPAPGWPVGQPPERLEAARKKLRELSILSREKERRGSDEYHTRREE